MPGQIEIKKSKIHGKGVFALKDFKRGEIVIKWHPKIISKDEQKSLNKKGKIYTEKAGNIYYLMQSPEKFVNHSCNPNTYVRNNCDVAKRLIKRGEEITSHYHKRDLNFVCNCKLNIH